MTFFEFLERVCADIQVVSDFCWDFPTNLEWYRSIPILGSLPLAVILLVGSGIFFSVRLRFIQFRKFGHGLQLLTQNRKVRKGITPLASFLLSTAMRVGPGNILGVTGAISVGGPGALFWMWVSAFFGMATAFTESTLSQIFKERRGDEFVGGFTYYGRRLLKDSAAVGVALSVLYIVYALLCFPAQGFNTISAVDQIATSLTGTDVSGTSLLNWISLVALVIFLTYISFGGIRKVSKVTDLCVPIMAVTYILVVLILISINLDRVPWFFKSVFTEAFRPESVFGGAFGICLLQGIKRGLMSNEAGQGTLTMAAATSNVKHPCDQGCIQAIGVFLDTIIICTLTAFVVIMGRMWLTDDADAWFAMGKLQRFVASTEVLTPGAGFQEAVSIIVSVCFGLFAFTCLLGFISFTEICAHRISTNKFFIHSIRVLCLVVVTFGILTSMAGMDLSSLWNLSDFANLLMVCFNLPLLYIGFKYVLSAVAEFDGITAPKKV